jgi:hypothetical protein
MLSRGGNRPGQRGRAPVDVVVYGALRGFGETGLTPVRLEADGTLSQEDAYGGQVELGAYGTHSWRRTTLGLDYRGDYRRSTTRRSYDGTNQALSLDLQYQASRRTMIFLRQTGGTSNRAFGGFAAPAFSDLLSLGLANNEVFDTRVYFSQSSAGVEYRRTARSSFIAIGDGFFVKRPSNALVSLTGYRALGAWQYRLNRRDSIGLNYMYMKFDYPRVFGGSDIHGLALTLQKRFTRNFDINLTGGAFRLESFGTQRVQLSPEVAALLGRTTGVEAFNRKSVIPQIQAIASYALERSRLTLSYISGASPGNGVYLTSQQDSVSAGYSFTGIRKLSLGASTGYIRTQSKSIDIGDLTSYRAGGGLSYALTRLLNFSSQFDWRTYSASGGLQGREGYSLLVGLTVSPARIPLSIW